MSKWLKSSLDYFIFYWYCLFAFVALIFEPLYYYGCNWNGLSCLTEGNLILHYTKHIWLFYAQWDPMFYQVPMWLRVMCSIEVFIFGPLYLLTAIGMVYDTAWFVQMSLPFAGALIYSTIVYFAMEIIENMPGTNMVVVFLVNLPWTIVPIMLVYQIVSKGQGSEKYIENKKSKKI